MKYCYIVSTFVIIVLIISVVWGKHKGRRSKDHSRHKHMRLLTHAKHFRQSKNHETLTYSDHRQQRGHHRPPGLKCRRIKFIVNRNAHLKKKTTAALKRQMTNKHTKSILHRVTTTKSPREAKLFEDRQGNLVTYIEDCVASENAEKKDFFESQRELYIEPVYGKKKTQRHSTHPSSKDDDISTVQSSEDEIRDDKILPATEDSLLQTVSDSSEILKDGRQDMKEEETAQLFNGQHETEVPSNFGTVFQAATVDGPLPKKPEEGSELQRYFSSAGETSIARINSDVVTPNFQQPLILDRQNGDQLPLRMPNAGFVSSPPRETQARFVSQLSEEYGNPLRDLEETHAKSIQNNGGYQAKTFSEAYDRLHNAEAQELAGFTNEAIVPQSLGEAMSVEKAEANYEKTYETLYGKDKSIRLQKGAAYLPEKDSN